MEANEVKDDTESVVESAHAAHEEDGSADSSAGPDAPAEAAALDHNEDHTGGVREAGGEPDRRGPGEHPLSHGESVLFEIDSSDDEGSHRLHLDTPEGETAGPAGGQEEEEPAPAPANDQDEEKDNASYEEGLRLQQELHREMDEARRDACRLQVKLANWYRRKAADDARPEQDTPSSEQLQEYREYIETLAELKLQLAAGSEMAERRGTEELRQQSQERLEEVEGEWRAILDVAVAAPSRLQGRQAAQAKAEATLAEERLRQGGLIALRRRGIRPRARVRQLEAGQRPRDPLQLRFEQLQAERLEQEKLAERKREESSKLQRRIRTSLELLSNVKEKLCWGRMEARDKREQLARLEATVAGKRDLLTGTKQARNALQRDNVTLKERRGLLGNRALLRDYEDAVDASEHRGDEPGNLRRGQRWPEAQL